MKIFARLTALAILVLTADVRADDAAWPKLTREMKPWTFWWWPGSAVDTTNITRELERFAAAGYGGVHISPIYGAKGAEARAINFLSPEWTAMLQHTVKEGARLDLGVDMTLGSGWCFGGPTVSSNDACWTLDPKTQKPEFLPKVRVKRAGPGGEGYMLNPFYGDAMTRYLERFTGAFDKMGGENLPRSVYHDSYEYFGCAWSPDIAAEFEKHRGYKLETIWPDLFGDSDSTKTARARCDYRETLSDMMIENAMPKWIEWAHARGMKTRFQAHGAPANWLDLYALADIPETEMFHTDRDILISKFASSAAHVTGKKLVSAETGTWLNEHFTETLGGMKRLVDQLFLSGVNHVVYHGACYSPDEAAWPGWLFYAATEMNSRNAIWRDLPALNAYIARCQSLLQAGEPDNDILLYWPIRDYWSKPGTDIVPMMTVHKREWFHDEEIGKTARWLWNNGYSFDYVSDRQIAASTVTSGFSSLRARAILVPAAHYIPKSTSDKLAELKKAGVNIVFGANSNELATAKVVQESLKAVSGLDFIRRHSTNSDNSTWYFIANNTGKRFDGKIHPREWGLGARFFDPMSGREGVATSRFMTNGVPLQLEDGESIFLRISCVDLPPPSWLRWTNSISGISLTGNWNIEFIAGGPERPAASTTNRLASWTERGGAAESFAGTARYSLTFDAPAAWSDGFQPSSTAGMPSLHVSQLDLGEVHESARVKLNGRDLGTLIMPPYRVVVDNLKTKDNVLEVEVTNLSANRIRDLDRRKVDWKVMKDINLVNLDYKPFDASDWPVRPSGLLGPVTLTPVVPAP